MHIPSPKTSKHKDVTSIMWFTLPLAKINAVISFVLTIILPYCMVDLISDGSDS